MARTSGCCDRHRPAGEGYRRHHRDGAVPRGDAPDDLDGLSGPLDGLGEGNAVPALHDLGTAGAEAEDETPLRECLERHGRHGEHRRAASAELHDPRRQAQLGGVGGEEGEGSERVERPELGHPHRVGSEAFRFSDELDGVVVEARRSGDTDAEGHLAPAPAGVAVRRAPPGTGPRTNGSNRQRTTKSSTRRWVNLAFETMRARLSVAALVERTRPEAG